MKIDIIPGIHQGVVYGSLYDPDDFGSGGSGATASFGSGGGVLKVKVFHTLEVEGVIESNGQSGSSSTGGGSGGSVWIKTKSLTGSGTIQVF